MTAVGFGPLERIDGPPPLAPEYGLLQAAAAPGVRPVRVVPDGDRWMNGVEVYPYPPNTGDVYDQCAPGSIQEAKDDGDIDIEKPEFGAFAAFLPVTCTSYKVWSQDEYKARAVAVFSAVESAIVANELMNGTRLPSNPHLADGNGLFPNGDTVTNISEGIALLEREIALTYRQGIIHVSPQIVASLREPWAINNKDGSITTLNGTLVVPDAGYAAGSHPTGHAAATAKQEWIYATGPIDVRRSETFVMPESVSQALDRGTPGGATMGKPNSITYRVERYYLVDWDVQLQAAVRVDRCQDGC